MNHDAYFRKPNQQPKLAPGIQRPKYQIPETNDYAKWCQDQIDRNKLDYAKNFPDENTVNNRKDVIQFHSSLGIRGYRDNDNIHTDIPTGS